MKLGLEDATMNELNLDQLEMVVGAGDDGSGDETVYSYVCTVTPLPGTWSNVNIGDATRIDTGFNIGMDIGCTGPNGGRAESNLLNNCDDEDMPCII